MNKIVVAGIGTGVGKTVVSAILTALFEGEYWKPIECGESDSALLKQWLPKQVIYPPVYCLKAPLSPHHAARLENIAIEDMTPPKTTRPLIIESVGGILVPLSNKKTTLDFFQSWDCKWIVVSRHYLGSINHTLMTLEILKKVGIPIAGVIFNGEANPDSEEAILNISQVPCLARLFPEENINSTTIQRYASQWNYLKKTAAIFGTRLPK